MAPHPTVGQLEWASILKYGHKDDEAVADANITTTVENRSRVAFPQFNNRKLMR